MKLKLFSKSGRKENSQKISFQKPGNGKRVLSCVTFHGNTLCYLFNLKNGKYTLEGIVDANGTDKNKKISKSSLIDDVDIDIKKIEIPKNAPQSLINVTLKKEFGEKFNDYIMTYRVESRPSEFDIMYVYYVEKDRVNSMMKVYSEADIISFVPFALLSYSLKFKDKSVFHSYIYRGYLLMLFSRDDIIYFYRTIKVESQESMLQNIMLTYKYVYNTLGKVDILLISFNADKEILTDYLKEIVQDTEVVFYDPESTITCQTVELAFESMLPVGSLNVLEKYNFIPSNIIEERNYRRLKKIGSLLFIAAAGYNLFNFYFNVLAVTDKFERLKRESQTVNSEISAIKDSVKDKDLDGIILMRKMLQEKEMQVEALNRVSLYRDIIANRPFSLTVQKTPYGYTVNINFVEKFDTLSQMESFCASISERARCVKYYENKSTEVFISYEVNKNQ